MKENLPLKRLESLRNIAVYIKSEKEFNLMKQSFENAKWKRFWNFNFPKKGALCVSVGECKVRDINFGVICGQKEDFLRRDYSIIDVNTFCNIQNNSKKLYK